MMLAVEQCIWSFSAKMTSSPYHSILCNWPVILLLENSNINVFEIVDMRTHFPNPTFHGLILYYDSGDKMMTKLETATKAMSTMNLSN